jgi:hypothetical protein
MIDPRSQSDPHFLTRRKRVVARQVNETEVEAANLHAAAITPDEILTPAMAENMDGATVVDPTTLGRRYRRSSHHRVYRWTQFCSFLGSLLAAISVICTMVDEVSPGRACAAPALGLGIGAIVLAGHNSLSARWRGWAIASAVFAAAALLLTWIQKALI